MFNFFSYNIFLEGTTLEKEVANDQTLYLSVLDRVENQIIKTNPFLQFLNNRGHLSVDIRENSIQFSTNPLAYVLAAKKIPDYEFKITKGDKW